MEKKINQTDYARVAEVELVYRTNVKPSERPKVLTSLDAYEIFMKHWNRNTIELREEFKIMLLNTSHRVIGILDSTVGGIATTVVDIRHVFVAALKANAACIIVAHNHPSGAIKPSKYDEILTKKISEAGRILDVALEEHLIITPDAFYSFADEGLL